MSYGVSNRRYIIRRRGDRFSPVPEIPERDSGTGSDSDITVVEVNPDNVHVRSDQKGGQSRSRSNNSFRSDNSRSSRSREPRIFTTSYLVDVNSTDASTDSQKRSIPDSTGSLDIDGFFKVPPSRFSMLTSKDPDSSEMLFRPFVRLDDYKFRTPKLHPLATVIEKVWFFDNLGLDTESLLDITSTIYASHANSTWLYDSMEQTEHVEPSVHSLGSKSLEAVKDYRVAERASRGRSDSESTLRSTSRNPHKSDASERSASARRAVDSAITSTIAHHIPVSVPKEPKKRKKSEDDLLNQSFSDLTTTRGRRSDNVRTELQVFLTGDFDLEKAAKSSSSTNTKNVRKEPDNVNRKRHTTAIRGENVRDKSRRFERRIKHGIPLYLPGEWKSEPDLTKRSEQPRTTSAKHTKANSGPKTGSKSTDHLPDRGYSFDEQYNELTYLNLKPARSAGIDKLAQNWVTVQPIHAYTFPNELGYNILTCCIALVV